MKKIMFYLLLFGCSIGIFPKPAQQASGYAPGDRLPIILEEEAGMDREEPGSQELFEGYIEEACVPHR